MNQKTIINKLSQQEWERLVRRQEAILMRSITDNAHIIAKKALGINWKVNNIVRLDDGLILYGDHSLTNLDEIFKQGGIKTLKKFKNDLVFHLNNEIKLANKINKLDSSLLNKTDLIRWLEKFHKAAAAAHSFLTTIVASEKTISQNILDLLPSAPEAKKRYWLGVLSFPSRENSHVAEERDFYKLVKAYNKRDSRYSEMLVEHVKKYGWIGARGYWWNNAWTIFRVEERIRDFNKQKKRPEAELKKLDTFRKENEIKRRTLIRSLKLKNRREFMQFVDLAQEFSFLRTWRSDNIYRSGYLLKDLFCEVARRAGFSEDYLAYLTYDELLIMARSGRPSISMNEVLKRLEFFALWHHRGYYHVLSGRNWKKLLEPIFLEKQKRVNQITGTPAHKGIATGKARLIMTPNDLVKMRRGEILITVMTFPHFISAMEKAKAFVTDEGGILCHAAIVSREMKKPCVIGTKNATQIFKDGDYLEVDANRGIVKKIEKK